MHDEEVVDVRHTDQIAAVDEHAVLPAFSPIVQPLELDRHYYLDPNFGRSKQYDLVVYVVEEGTDAVKVAVVIMAVVGAEAVVGHDMLAT